MYNFKESKLGPGFSHDFYKKAEGLIQASTPFTILGMPGVGVSFFLRYLASYGSTFTKANDIHFVFVDIYALSTLSRGEYLSWLLHELGISGIGKPEQEIFNLIKIQLQKLTDSHKKIVIIFNRFDQLKDEFDKQFLANIRSLKNIDPDKITMIFTANKPLYEVCPEAIIGTNLNFYSQTLYFGTYKDEDLKKLFLVLNPNSGLNSLDIDKLISLAGGHNQLLMILTKSESHENYLLDRFVKLQLSEIYEYLSYHQKKIVQNIAFGKDVDQIDQYLLKIGLVVTNHGYELFSPLFSEYVKTHTAVKIPAKEGLLFKLLKKNLNQVVSKEEIFDYVWKDKSADATEWALNSLVYRLRKNPGFRSSRLMLETHKKIGFALVKP